MSKRAAYVVDTGQSFFLPHVPACASNLPEFQRRVKAAGGPRALPLCASLLVPLAVALALARLHEGWAIRHAARCHSASGPLLSLSLPATLRQWSSRSRRHSVNAAPLRCHA